MLRTCVTFTTLAATRSPSLILDVIGKRLALDGFGAGAVTPAQSHASLEVLEGDRSLTLLCERHDERWVVFVTGLALESEFLREVTVALHAALSSMSAVNAVRWHFTNDWDAGRRSSGASEP